MSKCSVSVIPLQTARIPRQGFPEGPDVVVCPGLLPHAGDGGPLNAYTCVAISGTPVRVRHRR
jgi:hypothetical protein